MAALETCSSDDKVLTTETLSDAIRSSMSDDLRDASTMDPELECALRYVVSLCLRHQWRHTGGAGLHYFSQQELDTINHVWGITQDGVNEGYAFLDHVTETAYAHSGFICLYAGGLELLWRFGVNTGGVIHIWWA
jgi:hypothetical protein